jgi:hypothetical protein
LHKAKVEHVEEQKLGSKVDLQKVKIKHVEKRGINIRHTSWNCRTYL